MSDDSEFTGSCLCGDVAYKIVGSPDRFYHCHCKRCRKATGTAHASNLLLPGAKSAEFVRGAEQLTTYRVPGAKRFSTCFCKRCGSNLPRLLSAHNLVVIPAGSLDHEVEIKPQARIFSASGAAWGCSDSELPMFDEYPV